MSEVRLEDVESRPLRYFVAVAEELSFTRAARRLGMAGPPLSRAIRRLESDLGVALFERSTHHVALTPAGETLLAEARPALEALHGAVRRAQRAADAAPKLVLAMKADGDAGLLEPILEAYAAESVAEGAAMPPVEVRLCGWGEQVRLLRAGEADVALVHEPFDHAGLDAEPLVSEPRVAVLPAGHPLAAVDRLTVDDLGISDFAGHLDQITRTHRLQDLAQVLTSVELGRFVTLLPESVARGYPRPGLVYRPAVDAEPATLAIAWPQQSRSMAVAALVRAATAVSPGG